MTNYDHLKASIFPVILGVVILIMGFGYNKLVHLHDTVHVYESNKEVNLPWVFTTPSGKESAVITPLQVKLAAVFGDKVYDLAQEIRVVNKGNQFPSNNLLLAIAATESSFRVKAESSTSVGLLQINYKAHQLDRKDLFDVSTNTKHSVRVLKTLNHQCKGDLKCVLLSYNVGHNGYLKGRGNPEYYNKVMSYLNM